jgi:hypothetical protein
MLLEGLLGGARGFAGAVTTIAEDKRKQLAEKLKMEAIAEIDKAHQARGFAHDKEIQATDAELKEKDIASREKVASDRNATMERIAKMETDMKQRMLSQDVSKSEAQDLKNKIAASAESRKILEGGGSTEEANAVRQQAGLPLLEEFIAEEGREGILGFFKKDPVIGRRVEGDKSSPAPDELDALLAKGREMMSDKAEKTPEPAAGPPPEPKRASGLISQALEESAPISSPELGDPKTWDVRQQSGKFYIITSDGPREMTPEQIEQWKQATKGM